MEQCNFIYSHYYKVRETKCNRWFDSTDDLSGTQPDYGVLNGPLATDCNYNIRFDSMSYDELLISTVDREKWVVITETERNRLATSYCSQNCYYHPVSSNIRLFSSSMGKYLSGNNNDWPYLYLRLNIIPQHLMYAQNGLNNQLSLYNLLNHDGMSIFIRNTFNQPFSIKEDSNFAQIIIVAKSNIPISDNFPPFKFIASSLQLLWHGQCGIENNGSASYFISQNIISGDAVLSDCNQMCKDTTDCANFQIIISSKKCILFKAGCSQDYLNYGQDIKFYQKLDYNDMYTCTMAMHNIMTTDMGVFSCDSNSNKCDRVIVNVGTTGLFSYTLKVAGGPNNAIDSAIRQFRVCDPQSFLATAIFQKKQYVNYGSLVMEYLIPEFQNTDSNCPIVSMLSVYKSDCTTNLNILDNQNKIVSSLSNGFYHLQFSNIGGPQTYKFCIKMTNVIDNIPYSIVTQDLQDLEFITCDPQYIKSVIPINKNQEVIFGSSQNKFYLSHNFKSDEACSIQIKVKNEDCSTISKYFENSEDIMVNLSDGIIFANLLPVPHPQVFRLCLELISPADVIIVKDLQLNVKFNCSKAIIKVETQVPTQVLMYNSQKDQKTILAASDLFVNSEEEYCPITSVAIFDVGCSSEYLGDILYVSEKYEVKAKINKDSEIKQKICIVAQNQDQMISFDQINYKQFASCKKYLTADETSFPWFVTTNSDSKALFNFKQTGRKTKQIDLMKILKWQQNEKCGNQIQIEICQNKVCTKGSILKVKGAEKNESSEVILKIKTSETYDEYLAIVRVEKLLITQKFNIKSLAYVETNNNDSFDNTDQVSAQTDISDYDSPQSYINNQVNETSQNQQNKALQNSSETLEEILSNETCAIQVSSKIAKKEIKSECDFLKRLADKRKKNLAVQNKLKSKFFLEDEQLPPLEIRIDKFNHDGVLTLKFNQKVVNIFKITERRRLQDNQTRNEVNDYIAQQLFQFKLHSNLLTLTDLKTIQVNNWTDTEIYVKFVFKNPLKVSLGGSKDVLEVNISPQANNIIISQATYEEIEDRNPLNVELPSQLPSWLSLVEAEKQAASYKNGCISLIIVQSILQVFFKANFNLLIMLIQQLQLINALRIYHFQSSALTEIIFEQLQSLLNFELLSPNFYLNWFQPGLNMANMFHTSFQRFNDNQNPLFSDFTQGMIFILVFSLIFGFIYVLIRSQLFQTTRNKLDSIYNQQKKNLFFNRLIKMFMLSYVQQILICHTLLKAGKERKQLYFYIFLMIFPFLMGYLLFKNYDHLNSVEIRSKYGIAYDEISVYRNEKKTVLYFTAFFTKRGILLMIPLIDNCGIEIICLDLIMVGGILLYGYLRAHETKLRRNNELMNDFIFILILYSIISMTNFVEYETVIFDNGYQFLSYLILMTVCNLAIQVSLIKSKKELKERIDNKKAQIQQIHLMQALKRQKVNKEIPVKAKKTGMKLPCNLIKPEIQCIPEDSEADSSNLSSVNEYEELEHPLNKEDVKYYDDVDNRTFKRKVYSSINYRRTQNNKKLKTDSINRYYHFIGNKDMKDLNPLKLQETYISAIQVLTPSVVNQIELPSLFRNIDSAKITVEQHKQIMQLNQQMSQIINPQIQCDKNAQEITTIEEQTQSKRQLNMDDSKDLTKDQLHQIDQNISNLKFINGEPEKLPKKKSAMLQGSNIDKKTHSEARNDSNKNLLYNKLTNHITQMGQFLNHDFEQDPNNKIIQVMDDGSIYRGQLNSEGQPHRLGIMIYLNGATYEGFWYENLQNGQGILVKPDGQTLLGEFKSNQADGLFTIKYPDGSRYDGDLLCGDPHGKGDLQNSDGTGYSGQWWYGFKQGKGKEELPGNVHYEGQFQSGYWQGFGHYMNFTDKIFYNGNFESGYRHGYGELSDGNNPFYKGYFEMGKKHGQGQQTDKNYDCQIDLKIVREGTWKNDEFVE